MRRRCTYGGSSRLSTLQYATSAGYITLPRSNLPKQQVHSAGRLQELPPFVWYSAQSGRMYAIQCVERSRERVYSSAKHNVSLLDFAVCSENWQYRLCTHSDGKQKKRKVWRPSSSTARQRSALAVTWHCGLFLQFTIQVQIFCSLDYLNKVGWSLMISAAITRRCFLLAELFQKKLLP